MQFFLLLLQILPYLPDLIKTVEKLFGPGQGPQKLETAVKLLATVVPAVGESIAKAPEHQARLETVIGAVVAGLNANGKMNEPPTTFTPPDSGA